MWQESLHIYCTFYLAFCAINNPLDKKTFVLTDRHTFCTMGYVSHSVHMLWKLLHCGIHGQHRYHSVVSRSSIVSVHDDRDWIFIETRCIFVQFCDYWDIHGPRWEYYKIISTRREVSCKGSATDWRNYSHPRRTSIWYINVNACVKHGYSCTALWSSRPSDMHFLPSSVWKMIWDRKKLFRVPVCGSTGSLVSKALGSKSSHNYFHSGPSITASRIWPPLPMHALAKWL